MAGWTCVLVLLLCFLLVGSLTGTIELEWFCLHTLLHFPSFVIFSFSCTQAADCWHDLDNTEYDCWPINSPNDYNMISCGGGFLLSSLNDENFSCKLGTLFPLLWLRRKYVGLSRVHAYMHSLNVCAQAARVCVFTGLEMAWVQRPPEKVTNGEEFNVSYTVTASDSFYDYAVRNRIFQFR